MHQLILQVLAALESGPPVLLENQDLHLGKTLKRNHLPFYALTTFSSVPKAMSPVLLFQEQELHPRLLSHLQNLSLPVRFQTPHLPPLKTPSPILASFPKALLP